MYEIVVGRSEKDKQRFGLDGTILLGKHYVKMGQTTSLSNEIYLDMNTSHVVFICGKRGCLTEESLIFTDKGYKKIKDFEERKDKVLSYNKDKKKFEWENHVKLITYNLSNQEKMYEFEFEDGQKLITTEEHPLLVLDKKILVWKIASEIKKTDRIATAYHFPEVKKKSNSLRVARLLGFLLADGTMQIRKGVFKDGRGYLYNGRKARLRIINGSEEVLNQAKKDLEEEFNIKAKLYRKGKENCSIVETKHQRIVNFFAKLDVPFGKKDKIIKVPKVVWESSNKFKKEFLKALFSCDGFVDKTGSRVVYYSNSKKIMTDLNLLLGHFSIQSRIREKKTKCDGKNFLSYQLDIMDYKSVKNFEKIGFYQKEKNKRVRKRKFNQVEKRKSTIYIDDALFCQKIKCVKKVKSKNKVYDLRVPKNHSFIANGIISHNSGKSYTMGAMAEGMADLPVAIKNNMSIIILDTMGIYWTMKYPNKQDRKLLEEWDLEGKGLDITIYSPKGYFYQAKDKGIPVDYAFSISVSELDSHDWQMTFDVDDSSDVGVLIERVINNLQDLQENYDIDDIIKAIDSDNDANKTVKSAARNRFLAAKGWGIFDKQGTPLSELAVPGQVTVLDVSAYATMPGSWNIKSLVIGLVAEKLFIERMTARKEEEFKTVHAEVQYYEEETEKKKFPLVWLLIDEAHEFLPNKGKTLATEPLVTILREGRQPGISLVLATQQPGKIHTDVLTQADTIISHRITAKIDTDALGMLMQSYMRAGLDKFIDDLPREKGAAIILDDNNEKMYPMRVRPRMTWHGGSAPEALREKEKLLL